MTILPTRALIRHCNGRTIFLNLKAFFFSLECRLFLPTNFLTAPCCTPLASPTPSVHPPPSVQAWQSDIPAWRRPSRPLGCAAPGARCPCACSAPTPIPRRLGAWGAPAACWAPVCLEWEASWTGRGHFWNEGGRSWAAHAAPMQMVSGMVHHFKLPVASHPLLVSVLHPSTPYANVLIEMKMEMYWL